MRLGSSWGLLPIVVRGSPCTPSTSTPARVQQPIVSLPSSASRTLSRTSLDGMRTSRAGISARFAPWPRSMAFHRSGRPKMAYQLAPTSNPSTCGSTANRLFLALRLLPTISRSCRGSLVAWALMRMAISGGLSTLSLRAVFSLMSPSVTMLRLALRALMTPSRVLLHRVSLPSLSTRLQRTPAISAGQLR